MVKLFAKNTGKRLTSQCTPGVSMLEALQFYSSTLFLTKDGHLFETAVAQLISRCIIVFKSWCKIDNTVNNLLRKHHRSWTINLSANSSPAILGLRLCLGLHALRACLQNLQFLRQSRCLQCQAQASAPRASHLDLGRSIPSTPDHSGSDRMQHLDDSEDAAATPRSILPLASNTDA